MRYLKTYEKYNMNKDTIVINGYKMSNQSSLIDTIIKKPINIYDNRYDDYYEKGKYYGEGWWKVEETEDGGCVLFNPIGNEVVEINHKQGGKLGGVLNDFVCNNSRIKH